MSSNSWTNVVPSEYIKKQYILLLFLDAHVVISMKGLEFSTFERSKVAKIFWGLREVC